MYMCCIDWLIWILCMMSLIWMWCTMWMMCTIMGIIMLSANTTRSSSNRRSGMSMANDGITVVVLVIVEAAATLE